MKLRPLRSVGSWIQWVRAVWAGRRVSRSQYNRRIETCGECPEYNAAIQTCGECWCYMPIKARLAGMVCPLKKWG